MDPFSLAVLATLGLMGLVVVVHRPRLALAAACFAVLFTPTIAVVTGVGQVLLADDALVLGCFLYLPLHRIAAGKSLRGLPGGWLLVGALAAGILSSLAHQVPAAIAVSGGFLMMKGAMLGFAFAQEDWTPADVARMGKYVRAFLVVLVVCSVANFAAPGPWAAVFSSNGLADYRSALPSIIGPFTVPSFMGQITGLCVIAAVVFNRELGTRSRAIAALGFVAALLTFRRKTWLSLPVALAATFGLRNRATVLAFGVPALIAGAIIWWGPITQTVHDTRYEYFERATPAPRVLMYQGAVEIAGRDMPLGAGLGRWGSNAALTNYSPEYYSRGFQTVDGLGPQSQNNYATDTFWPIVVGETGYVGLVFYVGALVAIYARFRRATRSAAPAARAVGMIGTGWLALLLVESFAAPVFTGPPVYPWLFVAAGIAASLLSRGGSDNVVDPVNAESPRGRAMSRA